jgi:peptidoglycan-associated lipoprotein
MLLSSRCSSRWFSLLLLPLMLTMAVSTTGCNRSKVRKYPWEFWKPKSIEADAVYADQEILPPAPGVLDPSGLGESSALPPPPTIADAAMIPEPEPVRSEPKPISELHMIHFDYDSSQLSGEAQGLLNENAQWLMNRSNYDVQIEGHCDERGTAEYNMNLGMRRAKMVRDYLISRGVDPNRLHTISYGEERPLPPAGVLSPDQIYAQNRRVQFFIY